MEESVFVHNRTAGRRPGALVPTIRRLIVALLCTAPLAGCTLYHPKPLPTSPSLQERVPRRAVTAELLSVPVLRNHPFNPDDGLDITETAILAVVNNPDLRTQRDGRGIARAQLLAAGILPNPQLTAGLDHPTNSAAGLMNAYSLGISYDLGALITRSAAVGSARAAADKVDWGLIWQEWQVVQKARLLFIQITAQEERLGLLDRYQKLLADRARRTEEALREGNLTLDMVTGNQTELQAVQTRCHELERTVHQERQDLNALLGLAPTVLLRLTGPPLLPEVPPVQLQRALQLLPRRRPDLLALQAGYASQEEQFRQAVLAQFPALNLGVTRARDTSGINTTGIGVTMTLPIFDRNQGAIAVARATRRQLYDEYQARLNAAYGEVAALQEQQALLTRQLAAVHRELPTLKETARRARAALAAGEIDTNQAVALQGPWFEKRLEALSLAQTELEQRAMLLTLVGADFDDIPSAPQLNGKPTEGEVP